LQLRILFGLVQLYDDGKEKRSDGIALCFASAIGNNENIETGALKNASLNLSPPIFPGL